MTAKNSAKTTAAAPSAYTVHESVIISLARKAVAGIPGFVRFSGSSIVSDLADLVGSKRRFDKSIVVTEVENEVSLEILIVAAYGSKFNEVAAAVQKDDGVAPALPAALIGGRARAQQQALRVSSILQARLQQYMN